MGRIRKGESAHKSGAWTNERNLAVLKISERFQRAGVSALPAKDLAISESNKVKKMKTELVRSQGRAVRCDLAE
jgi:hypothetical protein